MDKDSGLSPLVDTTAANVPDLTPVAQLLYGEDVVVSSVTDDQGIEKRTAMEDKCNTCRLAI